MAVVVSNVQNAEKLTPNQSTLILLSVDFTIDLISGLVPSVCPLLFNVPTTNYLATTLNDDQLCRVVVDGELRWTARPGYAAALMETILVGRSYISNVCSSMPTHTSGNRDTFAQSLDTLGIEAAEFLHYLSPPFEESMESELAQPTSRENALLRLSGIQAYGRQLFGFISRLRHRVLTLPTPLRVPEDHHAWIHHSTFCPCHIGPQRLPFMDHPGARYTPEQVIDGAYRAINNMEDEIQSLKSELENKEKERLMLQRELGVAKLRVSTLLRRLHLWKEEPFEVQKPLPSVGPKVHLLPASVPEVIVTDFSDSDDVDFMEGDGTIENPFVIDGIMGLLEN